MRLTPKRLHKQALKRRRIDKKIAAAVAKALAGPNTAPIPDPNKRLHELPPLPPSSMTTSRFFDARDRMLHDLGYKSYVAYLHSHDWAVIRRRVLCLDRGACRTCGGPATEVHHSAYNSWALRGVDLTCLHSICRECHEFVEFDGETRRSHVESVAVLRRMIVATKGKTERKLSDQRADSRVLTGASHRHVVLSSLPTKNSSGMAETGGEIQATSQWNGQNPGIV